MKLTTITVLLLAGALTVTAAEEKAGWQVSIDANLNLSLNSYSDTWDGGEEGAFSWAAQLNTVLQKQLAKNLHNRNTLKFAFGQTKTQKEKADGSKGWSAPQKSTDLIDLESLFKFSLKKVVEPFVGVRFISQFLDASNPAENFYINPIQLTESFGGAAKILAKDKVTWDARLGGAVRHMITQVEQIDNTTDGGLEFVSEFGATNKSDNIKFASLLTIYEALFTSAEEIPGDKKNDWRYPDINWENTLSVNITKYIMLNWYIQFIYDKDGVVNGDLKWKNVASLGLTYSFTNKKAEAK